MSFSDLMLFALSSNQQELAQRVSRNGTTAWKVNRSANFVNGNCVNFLMN